MSRQSIRSIATFVIVLGLSSLAQTNAQCTSTLELVGDPISLPFIAPQGIAQDDDGSFWVTSALSRTIRQLDERFAPSFEFEVDFPDFQFGEGVNGITINTTADTLFVSRGRTNEIYEYTKDGVSTGVVLKPELPPREVGTPFIKGLAFNPDGDDGRGSIWIVATVTTAMYEVDLDGRIIASFCHPDDPDGCPGKGAAHAHGIELVKDGEQTVGLEFIGGIDQRDRIHQTSFDGTLTGTTYHINAVGGRPAGFTRGRYPSENGEIDVFFVVVESSAEIRVLQIVEPSLRPILELECAEDDGEVRISWRNTDNYENLELFREGELLSTLDPGDESFRDRDPPVGILEYEIRAFGQGCVLSQHCEVVTGRGEVLNAVFAQDALNSNDEAIRWIDLTEDERGLLWVTQLTPSAAVLTFDKDLSLLGVFASPFAEEENSITSGIAYNPIRSSFFIYDTQTHLVAEVNEFGEEISPRFASGVSISNPDDPPLVTAMLFNPEGDGGAGSFWYLNNAQGVLEERGRDASFIRRCVHPDQASDPAPIGSRLAAYSWGVSAVPGSNFSRLELAGGTVHDGSARRIFEFDPSTCERLPGEITTAGIAQFSGVHFLAHLRSTHSGRDVVYTIPSRNGSWLVELDASAAASPVPADLRASQSGESSDVAISFLKDPSVDSVEISRDGELVATLGVDDAAEFIDRDVTFGLRDYSARSVVAGARSDDRRVQVRVGPGALLQRAIATPVVAMTNIASGRHPIDDSDEFYVTSSFFGVRDSIHIFDGDLAKTREIPAPFTWPLTPAAITSRDVDGKRELIVVGFRPSVSNVDKQRTFPVRVIDPLDGAIERVFEITPPPARDGFFTFPVGMTWDEDNDTLWLFEQTGETISEFDVDGTLLRSFPNPVPAHQDSASVYGIAWHPENGTLFVSSTHPESDRVSRLVELTRTGQPTGFEVPLDSRRYSRSHGFVPRPGGQSWVVASSGVGLSELVEYHAYSSLATVAALACERDGDLVTLSWDSSEGFDSIAVYRENELLATLEGSATSFEDQPNSDCPQVYRVEAKSGSRTSRGAICESRARRPFIRGDVEENGQVNISDPIRALDFLFLGGDEPACLDAADVDDDGQVNITDAISLLNFLFLPGGNAPQQPYPLAGCDPTPDDLSCN